MGKYTYGLWTFQAAFKPIKAEFISGSTSVLASSFSKEEIYP